MGMALGWNNITFTIHPEDEFLHEPMGRGEPVRMDVRELFLHSVRLGMEQIRRAFLSHHSHNRIRWAVYHTRRVMLCGRAAITSNSTTATTKKDTFPPTRFHVHDITPSSTKDTYR